MVENGYKHVAERSGLAAGEHTKALDDSERRRILTLSAKQVGPALFYSLIIIVVSFLPVFLLEAQEGRMFRPLAWTKTLALVFSSLLSITLVPALMPLFIRGRLRPEFAKPGCKNDQSDLSAGVALVTATLEAGRRDQPNLPRCDDSSVFPSRQPIYAGAVRRLVAVHAKCATGNFHHSSERVIAGTGPHHPFVP